VNIPTPQKPIRKSGPLKRTTTSKSSFGLLPVLSNCASQCNHHKVLLKKNSSTKCSSKVTSKSSNCGPPSTFPIWQYLIKQPVPPYIRQSPPSPSHNDGSCPSHSSPTKAQTTSGQPENLDRFTPATSSISNIASPFTPLKSSLLMCPLQKQLYPTSPWFPSDTLRSQCSSHPLDTNLNAADL